MRYALSLFIYRPARRVASETSNGRNGPCPVHLPLQAESNFRAAREQETRRSALCERECAPTRSLEINNTLHAKMAAQLDGNGCCGEWTSLLSATVHHLAAAFSSSTQGRNGSPPSALAHPPSPLVCDMIMQDELMNNALIKICNPVRLI